jgi:hypothetical protein
MNEEESDTENGSMCYPGLEDEAAAMADIEIGHVVRNRAFNHFVPSIRPHFGIIFCETKCAISHYISNINICNRGWGN